MKKISFILALFICLSCFAAFPQSASAYHQGRISSTVTWTLYDNGLLNFSGSGAAIFSLDQYTIPDKYADEIKEIVLSEGITMLSASNSSTFEGDELPNLKKITLSSTCVDVWNVPFKCSNLQKYVVPSNNVAFKSKDGVLYERNKDENGTYKNTYTIRSYPAGKTAEKYTMESNVTAVGESAFRNNKHLKQVVLADSVTIIDRYAFEGCTALSKVEFPLSLETLRSRAFSGCSALTVANITGRITRLGEGAFAGCTSLATVSFPSTLEYINTGCFRDCISLKKLDLKNIKSIGGGGLFNCQALEELHIPAGLGFHSSDYHSDSPGSYNSFLGNNLKLKNISVDSANPYYCSVDGVLYSKDKTTLYSYPAGKENKEFSTIESATRIEEYAFYGANNLESLTVYASNIIGFYAFDGCDSVTKLAFMGEKLFNISDSYFPNLRSLEFSDDIKGLFEITWFSLNTKLPSEVVLPNGFYDVKKMLLEEYSPFKTIYIFKTPELFEEEQVGNIIYRLTERKEQLKKANIDLIRLDENGSCGENATFVLDKNGKLVITGTGAVDSFPWSEYPRFIKEVVIGEGISSIGANAFAGCALKKITLPSSLAEGTDLSAIVPPEPACDKNCVFVGWDKTEGTVDDDITITASFKHLGDVTGDGRANSLDAAFILRYDAGLIGEDKLDFSVADVTGDGKINSQDAAFVLRFDAALLSVFPAWKE